MPRLTKYKSKPPKRFKGLISLTSQVSAGFKQGLIFYSLWLCFGFAPHAEGVVLNKNKNHKGSKKSSKKGSKKYEDEGEDVNSQLSASFPDIGAFPFSSYVGKIGLGSGIYLGNGYVLTSAHVGCYPFVAKDGSIYRPIYETWQVLSAHGKKADLAVFQVDMSKTDSLLSHLEPLPFSSRNPQAQDLMVLVGGGLVQRHKPVEIKSGDKVLGVLGYRTDDHRKIIAGLNTVSKVLDEPVLTRDFETDCFVAQFGRNQNEAQAVDGDSGGASFLYNPEQKRWELAGCIIAVSQADRFVPFGSQTYFANLSRYMQPLMAATNSELPFLLVQNTAADSLHHAKRKGDTTVVRLSDLTIQNIGDTQEPSKSG